MPTLPCIWLAKKGYFDQIKMFTAKTKKETNHGVRVNKLLELKNYDGWNCLHLAVQNGHMNIADYLITDLKVNPNIPGGSRGMTPCHIAVEIEDTSMLIYLLSKAEIDVDMMTYDKWTPFQMAAVNNHEAELTLLLSKTHSPDPLLYLFHLFFADFLIHP